MRENGGVKKRLLARMGMWNEESERHRREEGIHTIQG
jgi:hypothetical protein